MNTDITGELSFDELATVTGGCMTQGSGGSSAAAGVIGAGVLVGATIGFAALGAVAVGVGIGALISEALK